MRRRDGEVAPEEVGEVAPETRRIPSLRSIHRAAMAAVVAVCLSSCAGKSVAGSSRPGPEVPELLALCLTATSDYATAIGDLTGADTLSAALSSVGEAFDACSAARTSLEGDPDLLALADEDRAHLLEPLVDLLDTMSLHTIVLAIGVADPTVFDAGPDGADGFRRPTEHLADALRRRWGILHEDALER